MKIMQITNSLVLNRKIFLEYANEAALKNGLLFILIEKIYPKPSSFCIWELECYFCPYTYHVFVNLSFGKHFWQKIDYFGKLSKRLSELLEHSFLILNKTQ